MTDKPILFSAPMIRALLDGRKTQTRRVLKPWLGMQAKWLTMETLHRAPSCYLGHVDGHLGAQMQHPLAGTAQPYGEVDAMSPLTWVRLPYAPGDRLWVRESWSGTHEWRKMKPRDRARCGSPSAAEAWYWADGSPDFGDWEKPRPSIHMPRWASRLTLVVTDVRVQRLQDISEEDARSEGARFAMEPTRKLQGWTFDENYSRAMARDSFAHLWDSINAKRGFGWDDNPWVTATTFTVHRCNIDQMEDA